MKFTSLWVYKKKMEAQISPLLKAFWSYELDFMIFLKNLDILHAWSKNKIVIYSPYSS